MCRSFHFENCFVSVLRDKYTFFTKTFVRVENKHFPNVEKNKNDISFTTDINRTLPGNTYASTGGGQDHNFHKLLFDYVGPGEGPGRVTGHGSL